MTILFFFCDLLIYNFAFFECLNFSQCLPCFR